MTVIAVASVKGTVGATVVAAGLAAAVAERRPVVLVEADPSGGSLAGVCPQLLPAPGLELLANDRDVLSDERFASVCQMLARVPVIVAPADGFRSWVSVATPRNLWWSALARRNITVIIDVGRLGGGSPSWPIVELADRVLIVTPPSPLGLAMGLEWCEQGGRVAPAVAGVDPAVCRLVAVQPPVRRRDASVFDVGEVRAQAGSWLAGAFPWDPTAVDLLFRGAELAFAELSKSSFAGAARALAVAMEETA
jgi:hypothetical protein